MRNESLSGRIEFNERRAARLEGAVMYQPSKGDSVPPERSSRSEPGRREPPGGNGPTTRCLSRPDAAIQLRAGRSR